MNLNRRDFAKTGLGGLLTFLVPGKAKADDGPRWPPMCPKCVWLGRWQSPDHLISPNLYDLWACKSTDAILDHLHLAARYGPESAVTTWEVWPRRVECFQKTIARDVPQLGEAFRRAVAHGLMPKVKPRSTFPRWFTPIKHRWDTLPDQSRFLLLVAYAETRVKGRYADGRHFVKMYRKSKDAPRRLRRMTIADCEQWLSDGTLREITAAEASALLGKAKPKPQHNYPKYFVSVKGFVDWTAYAVRNADGSWYCVARDGSHVPAPLNSCRRMGLYGGFDTLVSDGYWREITAAEAKALLKQTTE